MQPIQFNIVLLTDYVRFVLFPNLIDFYFCKNNFRQDLSNINYLKNIIDMKKIVITMFSIVMVLILKAQNSETRNLLSFEKVSVGNSIDLIIKEGNENKVIIETSGMNSEDVLTEVSGNKLSIQMARGNYRNTTVNVYLTYKKLNSLKVSSSASLKGESVLKSSDLKIKVSSSARANLEIEVDKLQVAVSSSGRLNLSGNVRTQIVDVSSSGRYSGYELKSQILDADVSSSGRVEVYVTEKINARTSSSGRVTYKGNPDKVIADSSSSGKVRKAE